jgi:hypothetical protein
MPKKTSPIQTLYFHQEFETLRKKLHTIRFSYNWNKKLDCDVFATMRTSTGKNWNPGELALVDLKNQVYGVAEVVSVVPIPFSKITLQVALLDTGYNLAEFQDILIKMYPETKPDTVFRWIFFRWKEHFPTLLRKKLLAEKENQQPENTIEFPADTPFQNS